VSDRFRATISDAEIKQLNATLLRLGKRVEKNRRKVLLKAAKILTESIRSYVPVAPKIVVRYKYKGKNAKKSGKGEGKIVAIYLPGNLRRSIKVLPLRRTEAVFVGPKLAKGSSSKGFFASNSRVDGWYAHFMEYGTSRQKGGGKHFMRRGFDSSKAQLIHTIKSGFKQIILDVINKRI